MHSSNGNENLGPEFVSQKAERNQNNKGDGRKDVCGGNDGNVSRRNRLLGRDLEQECRGESKAKADDQANCRRGECEKVANLGSGYHANAGLQGDDKRVCLNNKLESCLR